MKQMDRQAAKTRSLSDTQANNFTLPSPAVDELRRAWILQIYPATAQAEMFPLSNRRTLIGREPSCDIALDDDAISRSHAVIEQDSPNYFVSDLGSRNGTFVDDQLLRNRQRLSGGELIRLGGTILKFMASMDEEAQYHAVVHELMTRDPLTNSFNRSYLMSSLKKILPRCQFTQQDLAIIMIDVDHFKRVNDSYGHLVGDEVLRVFSERIRRTLREDNTLCRFGGEEFVVFSERTDIHGAVRIAERIRIAVSSTPFSTQSGPLSVTCSLGVTTLNQTQGASVDQLLSAADGLMYAAKACGRNRVRSALDQ